MLTLVGLGLFDKLDLTLRGMEAAKAADKVYVELYTSKWNGLKELEKKIGKKVIELERKDLEEGSRKIIEESKSKKVVLFVPGDPLIATTHVALAQEARKAGIETKIVHNASIISAVAETGLHIYKFGASPTIPFPEKTKGKLPDSVYDIIKLNKKAGFHTLLLLDITPERCMKAKEAIKILLEIEEKRKENVFTKDTNAVVFARAGRENSLIAYEKVKNLLKRDFGEPPMVLIVPGTLHFTEEEYLESL